MSTPAMPPGEGSAIPSLTPRQLMETQLAADAVLIDSYKTSIACRDRLIADLAERLFATRDLDAQIGGRELERRAEANLRAALAKRR